MTVSFEEGRRIVLAQAALLAPTPTMEQVPILAAAGRVLAAAISADRDYPPVARSIRDGVAVHSGDLPGRLRVIGEVRAGETFSGNVGRGEAVEIFTGAPVPAGVDQVVMVEHTSRAGDFVETARPGVSGEFINPAGAEIRAGAAMLTLGRRLGFAEIAALATVGVTGVPVYARPRVAILATGDEVVEIAALPRDNQVRNSNSYSIAAQVLRAGGIPEILPVARDTMESTRAAIERGLTADLLLLSGGVSAGKYDLVEIVLAEMGAQSFFDRVLIQPGQPLVFGQVAGKMFFGLPGNPASTMVTFEIFARAAVEMLAGEAAPLLPILQAPMAVPFAHKTGLTRFLPATLDGGLITPVRWQGSSDVAALARANCFLVASADRPSWNEGDLIGVLMK
ncbi:MAG: molybdopterin molybdotransferase MoeA [Acidobacteria bacterium]|nr:molybdopterin molybdotransferase MoeA [Acidobacteriota bacterium]